MNVGWCGGKDSAAEPTIFEDLFGGCEENVMIFKWSQGSSDLLEHLVLCIEATIARVFQHLKLIL
jgi:hypothetical protein